MHLPDLHFVVKYQPMSERHDNHPLKDVMHAKISSRLIIAVLVAATLGILIGRQIDNRVGFLLGFVFVLIIFRLRGRLS